jgi:hypothetical protein
MGLIQRSRPVLQLQLDSHHPGCARSPGPVRSVLQAAFAQQRSTLDGHANRTANARWRDAAGSRELRRRHRPPARGEHHPQRQHVDDRLDPRGGALLQAVMVEANGRQVGDRVRANDLGGDEVGLRVSRPTTSARLPSPSRSSRSPIETMRTPPHRNGSARRLASGPTPRGTPFMCSTTRRVRHVHLTRAAVRRGHCMSSMSATSPASSHGRGQPNAAPSERRRGHVRHEHPWSHAASHAPLDIKGVPLGEIFALCGRRLRRPFSPARQRPSPEPSCRKTSCVNLRAR